MDTKTDRMFSAGDIIHGYIVETSLGKGSIGSVYLVRHTVLGTSFAMKILDRGLAEGNAQYVKRFLREAILASRIRHPNLVAVHDAGYDDKHQVYYIVMDYIQGRTLRRMLSLSGCFSEKEAVRIISCVANALDAGQRFGMVHRDIKPGNIMVTDDGVVKLIDLGIAKVSESVDSLRTMGNTVFGTPAYISPEQAMDSSTVDVRSDIYSLGIVFFEMLCGHNPYEGKSFKEIIRNLLSPDPLPDIQTFNAQVSPKISAVIKLMCEKAPNERIASPAALLAVLAKLGYGEAERPNAFIGDTAAPDSNRNGTLSGLDGDRAVEDFLSGRRRVRLFKRIVTGVLAALAVFGIVWAGIRFFSC
ncbi:MAG: serine/threonine protein kinase [Kiritimatiellae bacterium]|nr:serine/threonine protein kinase [Kiritimatiellia bacterium]